MPQRTVDTVIFDLGGVIMSNGKPSDFASRFPEADRERVIEIIMGPYGQDSDHPWHRVERGEITMEECRSLSRDAMIESGIMPILSTMQPQAQESSSTGGISFNFSLSEPMVQLIHELRDNDIRIGVLTNNVREFREWWWTLKQSLTPLSTVLKWDCANQTLPSITSRWIDSEQRHLEPHSWMTCNPMLMQRAHSECTAFASTMTLVSLLLRHVCWCNFERPMPAGFCNCHAIDI